MSATDTLDSASTSACSTGGTRWASNGRPACAAVAALAAGSAARRCFVASTTRWTVLHARDRGGCWRRVEARSWITRRRVRRSRAGEPRTKRRSTTRSRRRSGTRRSSGSARLPEPRLAAAASPGGRDHRARISLRVGGSTACSWSKPFRLLRHAGIVERERAYSTCTRRDHRHLGQRYRQPLNLAAGAALVDPFWAL